MTLNLGMQHRVLEYYQVCANDDPELTLTYMYFTAQSNLVPYAFVLEKGKTMDFSETIVIYDLKLATDDGSDKKFLLTSKLCPLRALCPLPRGYKRVHILNHENMRLEGDFFQTCKNDRSDKMFLLTSKFCPQGVVSPCPGAIINMYKIMKKNV